MAKQVTILILTYNRGALLEAVLPSYANQSVVDRIIVVNDGSTDDTLDRLTKLAAMIPIPIQCISHEQKQGQQAARMRAIAEAQTDWVLFGEDDVWLSPDYCTTLLREATDLNADAIAGRLVTAHMSRSFCPEAFYDKANVNETDDIFDMAMIEADFSARPSRIIPAPHLHTVALIRRSVFDKIGFDAGYGGNGWREETDFYFGLNSAGGRVYFSPNTVCFHIRGPISATGGQRTSRINVEYCAFFNTLRLVRKHWTYLNKNFGFAGSPLLWTLCYFVRRLTRNINKVINGHKSAFRGIP